MDYTATYNAVYGPNNVPMCKEFLQIALKAYTLKSVASYSLTIFNIILRTVVIAAVTWIGYSTQTALIERVTIVTFLCQFFSTAFILLLVNADLKEQPFSFGIVYGDKGDFNSAFFRQAGEVLISTMIFNALYPLLDFAINWAMRFVFRLLDRGFTRNRFSTK